MLLMTLWNESTDFRSSPVVTSHKRMMASQPPLATPSRIPVRTKGDGKRITTVSYELVQFLTGFDIP